MNKVVFQTGFVIQPDAVLKKAAFLLHDMCTFHNRAYLCAITNCRTSPTKTDTSCLFLILIHRNDLFCTANAINRCPIRFHLHSLPLHHTDIIQRQKDFADTPYPAPAGLASCFWFPRRSIQHHSSQTPLVCNPWR